MQIKKNKQTNKQTNKTNKIKQNLATILNIREGQIFLATTFFFFTWVHLYKVGCVYITYEPLSVIPHNMVSTARLVALQY